MTQTPIRAIALLLVQLLILESCPTPGYALAPPSNVDPITRGHRYLDQARVESLKLWAHEQTAELWIQRGDWSKAEQALQRALVVADGLTEHPNPDVRSYAKGAVQVLNERLVFLRGGTLVGDGLLDSRLVSGNLVPGGPSLYPGDHAFKEAIYQVIQQGGKATDSEIAEYLEANDVVEQRVTNATVAGWLRNRQEVELYRRMALMAAGRKPRAFRTPFLSEAERIARAFRPPYFSDQAFSAAIDHFAQIGGMGTPSEIAQALKLESDQAFIAAINQVAQTGGMGTPSEIAQALKLKQGSAEERKEAAGKVRRWINEHPVVQAHHDEVLGYPGDIKVIAAMDQIARQEGEGAFSEIAQALKQRGSTEQTEDARKVRLWVDMHPAVKARYKEVLPHARRRLYPSPPSYPGDPALFAAIRYVAGKGGEGTNSEIAKALWGMEETTQVVSDDIIAIWIGDEYPNIKEYHAEAFKARDDGLAEFGYFSGDGISHVENLDSIPFAGRYSTAMDEKFRVRLPAVFFRNLKERSVIFQPMPQLGAYRFVDASTYKLMHDTDVALEGDVELDIDNAGRLYFDRALQTRMGLEGRPEMVWVGAGSTFELWPLATYEEYRRTRPEVPARPPEMPSKPKFIGRTGFKMGKKGRVQLGGEWVQKLSGRQWVVLEPTAEGSVRIFPSDEWQKKVIEHAPKDPDELAEYERAVYGHAPYVLVRDKGRLSLTGLSRNQVKRLGLRGGSEVILIGAGDHVELWSRRKYEAYAKKNSMDLHSLFMQMPSEHKFMGTDRGVVTGKYRWIIPESVGQRHLAEKEIVLLPFSEGDFHGIRIVERSEWFRRVLAPERVPVEPDQLADYKRQAFGVYRTRVNAVGRMTIEKRVRDTLQSMTGEPIVAGGELVAIGTGDTLDLVPADSYARWRQGTDQMHARQSIDQKLFGPALPEDQTGQTVFKHILSARDRLTLPVKMVKDRIVPGQSLLLQLVPELGIMRLVLDIDRWHTRVLNRVPKRPLTRWHYKSHVYGDVYRVQVGDHLRMVLNKAVMKQMGLKPSDPIEIVDAGGYLELRTPQFVEAVSDAQPQEGDGIEHIPHLFGRLIKPEEHGAILELIGRLKKEHFRTRAGKGSISHSTQKVLLELLRQGYYFRLYTAGSYHYFWFLEESGDPYVVIAEGKKATPARESASWFPEHALADYDLLEETYGERLARIYRVGEPYDRAVLLTRWLKAGGGREGLHERTVTAYLQLITASDPQMARYNFDTLFTALMEEGISEPQATTGAYQLAKSSDPFRNKHRTDRLLAAGRAFPMAIHGAVSPKSMEALIPEGEEAGTLFLPVGLTSDEAYVLEQLHERDIPADREVAEEISNAEHPRRVTGPALGALYDLGLVVYRQVDDEVRLKINKPVLETLAKGSGLSELRMRIEREIKAQRRAEALDLVLPWIVGQPIERFEDFITPLTTEERVNMDGLLLGIYGPSLGTSGPSPRQHLEGSAALFNGLGTGKFHRILGELVQRELEGARRRFAEYPDREQELVRELHSAWERAGKSTLGDGLTDPSSVAGDGIEDLDSQVLNEFRRLPSQEAAERLLDLSDDSLKHFRLISKYAVLSLLHADSDIRLAARRLIVALARAGSSDVTRPGELTEVTAFGSIFRKVIVWIALEWRGNTEYIVSSFMHIYGGSEKISRVERMHTIGPDVVEALLDLATPYDLLESAIRIHRMPELRTNQGRTQTDEAFLSRILNEVYSQLPMLQDLDLREMEGMLKLAQVERGTVAWDNLGPGAHSKLQALEFTLKKGEGDGVTLSGDGLASEPVVVLIHSDGLLTRGAFVARQIVAGGGMLDKTFGPGGVRFVLALDEGTDLGVLLGEANQLIRLGGDVATLTRDHFGLVVRSKDLGNHGVSINNSGQVTRYVQRRLGDIPIVMVIGPEEFAEGFKRFISGIITIISDRLPQPGEHEEHDPIMDWFQELLEAA